MSFVPLYARAGYETVDQFARRFSDFKSFGNGFLVDNYLERRPRVFGRDVPTDGSRCRAVVKFPLPLVVWLYINSVAVVAG